MSHQLILPTRWAMTGERLAPLVSLYEGWSSGDQEVQRAVSLMLSESRREAREERERRAAVADKAPTTEDLGYIVKDGVAQVSFVGMVTKDPTCLGSFMGGDAVTTDLIRTMRAVTDDPNVKRTLLRIDSPGGTVDGTAAAAEAVYRANQAKPITAFVDGMACSAAWWIASAASRRVGDEVATSGSMGVYALLMDTTRAYENKGVKVRLVKSAPGKGAGYPGTPVTDAQVAALQLEVDTVAEVFIQAVARNLGISVDQARAMADGEPYTGARALAAGFLDAIQHLGDTLDELTAEANGPAKPKVWRAGGGSFVRNSNGAGSSGAVVPESRTESTVTESGQPEAQLPESQDIEAQDTEQTPPDEPTETAGPDVVAHALGPLQEAPMSDPTPKAPAASEQPAPQSTATLGRDDVMASVSKALDEVQGLRNQLAALQKDKLDASTEALLKAHEDKFLPAEAHRAAARTIAASFPAEFALLMGQAKAVRPKVGAAPVYQREAGDGVEQKAKDQPKEKYLEAVEAHAAGQPGRSLVSVMNDFETN